MYPVSPTRDAGLARLQAFLPRAGRAYAERRNHDLGPLARENVSGLSPYIRHRMLTEGEVIAAVLAHHTPSAAEKFIQEVCWRTYWKGWLEFRPAVWHRYLNDLAHLSRSAAYTRATEGRTGIACFDAWVAELLETGTLHNHARMWFASIWCHTLGLPWQLGAEFFLTHLLDGDPASNTLSWRWVVGLQTAGKTYLARPDNITTYTGGRFHPDGLSPVAAPFTEPALPRAAPLAPCPALTGPCALLLTIEDLHPESLPLPELTGIGLLADAGAPPRLAAWRAQALQDAADRAQCHFNKPAVMLDGTEAVVAWARGLGVPSVATAYAPVGPTQDRLSSMAAAMAAEGIALVPVRRAWDEAAWPHATRGFFAFREQIPRLIAGLHELPLFKAAINNYRGTNP